MLPRGVPLLSRDTRAPPELGRRAAPSPPSGVPPPLRLAYSPTLAPFLTRPPRRWRTNCVLRALPAAEEPGRGRGRHNQRLAAFWCASPSWARFLASRPSPPPSLAPRAVCAPFAGRVRRLQLTSTARGGGVAGQRRPCSWHRVRLSKVATRFGVGGQARGEPVRYLDFTCRGAGTLTLTGRGALIRYRRAGTWRARARALFRFHVQRGRHADADWAGAPARLSICVSSAVRLCVDGCPSVCQRLSVCVSGAVHLCDIGWTRVPAELSVCVSSTVRLCVGSCPSVCQDLSVCVTMAGSGPHWTARPVPLSGRLSRATEGLVKGT